MRIPCIVENIKSEKILAGFNRNPLVEHIFITAGDMRISIESPAGRFVVGQKLEINISDNFEEDYVEEKETTEAL